VKRAGPSSPGRRRLFALPLLLAAMACARAAVLDPESDTFYQMARHLLTRNEERVFRRLAAPELRRDFIRAFWEIAIPIRRRRRTSSATNGKRLAFVNGHFREPTGTAGIRLAAVYLVGRPTARTRFPPQRPDLRHHPLALRLWFTQFVDAQGFGSELDMAHTLARWIT
jgi:hypothetical protein